MAAPPFIALYLADGTVANTAPAASNAERSELTRAFLVSARDHEELVMLDTANLTWRSYAIWNPEDEEPEDALVGPNEIALVGDGRVISRMEVPPGPEEEDSDD